MSFVEPCLPSHPTFHLPEINKIIAEASKGSKFYENERIKDVQLGRKIQATLQKVRLLDVSLPLFYSSPSPVPPDSRPLRHITTKMVR